jgi:hypothetical protein
MRFFSFFFACFQHFKHSDPGFVIYAKLQENVFMYTVGLPLTVWPPTLFKLFTPFPLYLQNEMSYRQISSIIFCVSRPPTQLSNIHLNRPGSFPPTPTQTLRPNDKIVPPISYLYQILCTSIQVSRHQSHYSTINRLPDINKTKYIISLEISLNTLYTVYISL